MNFVIKKALLSLPLLVFAFTVYAATPVNKDVLIKQIKSNGFVPARDLYQNPDEPLVKVGGKLFASKAVSLNGDISCQTCHLDNFGSGDGIPIAAAIGAEGEGPKRLLNGAKLLQRNTLPLWGRGSVGFETFFSDGRVERNGSTIKSQFGSKPPSDDLFVVAVHLPAIEIREMLDEDEFIKKYKVESVNKSKVVYKAIADNITKNEPEIADVVAKYVGKSNASLDYADYGRALAAFIRSKFRIRETPFERFVEGGEGLSESALRGGIVFYGKGGCVSCHNGPHFSDFKYHAVPFPQLGAGKNGFGIDYGRYNATFNPKDMYKFRTAPLFNVSKTAPYGHSGSVRTLREAIVAHYDPLSLIHVKKMDGVQRYELAKRISYSDSLASVAYLSPNDLDDLEAFLRSLDFEPQSVR
jgi:cytochrome c peroxidase